eukprot:CAMPEP_0183360288 /NCGR_PEP_ID=MMETSP0164_2-20130417/54811_1 /TAXON_ID=221442 /ORGANISM="Coccolithus pelagicus ssp braarudi, Strain PLY182g" /LENGTH=114 /DNA_ID=CAMNT_0025534615 /DNA_START=422 /DNA_END=766 /DNA_ORIENTATION=+
MPDDNVARRIWHRKCAERSCGGHRYIDAKVGIVSIRRICVYDWERHQPRERIFIAGACAALAAQVKPPLQHSTVAWLQMEAQLDFQGRTLSPWDRWHWEWAELQGLASSSGQES